MAPLGARGAFGAETAGSWEQLETRPKGTGCYLKEKKFLKMYHPCPVTRNHKCAIVQSTFVFVKIQTLARLKRAFSPAAALPQICTHRPPEHRRLKYSPVAPRQTCKGKCKLETAALLANSPDHAYS